MPLSSSVITKVLLVIVLAALTTALRPEQVRSQNPTRKYAFATLLCDEKTTPALYALHTSLQASHPDIPLLVLMPHSSALAFLKRVLALPHARPIRFAMPTYPFRRTTNREAIEKPCRYIKLHLWSLTEWDRIVFLDADTVVLRPIDELFKEPDFSAVKDPVGDNVNTGVMVVKPSAVTHGLLMKSYLHVDSFNIGDQGTLNSLVDMKSWHRLRLRFNTFQSALSRKPTVKEQDAAKSETVPRMSLSDVKVLHFSGESKPWKFWRDGHLDRHISPAAYLKWCEYAGTHLSSSCTGPTLPNFVSSDIELPGDTSQYSKFTVLLSTYHRNTWQSLSLFFADLPFIQKVVVIWHDPHRPLPSRPPHPSITIFKPQTNTLNNRFLPIEITTPGVYIADDDILISPQALKRGFLTWRNNPQQLVGYYPRFYSYNRSTATATYSMDIKETGYNIMLTKGFFTHKYFLFLYTQILASRFTKVVDRYNNCEDILFNMMVSGHTGLPPLAVVLDAKREGRIIDVGRKDGISSKGGHLNVREKCIREFVEMGMRESGPVSHGSMVL